LSWARLVERRCNSADVDKQVVFRGSTVRCDERVV